MSAADATTSEPHPIAHCAWHQGRSDTARLVQAAEAVGGIGAGNLFACEGCRTMHGLTPLADQP